MSEKMTEGEKLAKKLLHKIEPVFDKVDKRMCEELCGEYIGFLNRAKTERKAVSEFENELLKLGFKPFEYGRKISAGDRLYSINRKKTITLIIGGSLPLKEGVRLTAAHIDSPRLDLKSMPLYEDADLAWFKTHYYGGVKKYQWTATPLSLYGTVVTKDGAKIDVSIGDDPGDPVFCVTDLLPHLAKDQVSEPLSTAIKAEKMNVLVGSLPFADDKVSEKVKLNILNLLYEKYNMTEYDFLTADLSFVPSYPAREVGLDRSFIGAYGHDDRVCAYTAFKAAILAEAPKHTLICTLVDREEIGSDGVSGLQSDFLYNILASFARAEKADLGEVCERSSCLSADVSAAFDPNFSEAYDKRNASALNCGPSIMKYTGRAGKADTSEATAEFMAEIRGILDAAGVSWQIGSMGKVDQGGGGTVAKYIARRNIDTVDIGVPVLNMHAPFEIVAKCDVYMTFLAFKAFLES